MLTLCGRASLSFTERAAKNLDFERAAEIRDLIKKFKNGKENTYADN